MSEHGGDLARAVATYGLKREQWIDLSTGINPNGYEIKGLPQACFHDLPDVDAVNELSARARAAYGVKDTMGLLSVPGSEFLIQILPQIRPTSKVAVLSPTYSSHEAAWRRYGHQVRTVDSLDSVEDETVVVVVNPNNPDGMVTSHADLARLARSLEERGGLLVIDEAFVDVVPEVSFVPALDLKNVLVLRSIGKFYGLAGLRLGFVIGANRLLERVRVLLGAWSVSGPAIEVGRRVLHDQKWAETTRAVLKRQSEQHLEVFKANGLKVVGGMLLFHLIELDDARTLQHELAKRGIWTRAFEHHRTWLRLGLCQSQSDLARFAATLEEVMSTSEVAA